MNIKYLVMSPGRSGSVFVARAISKATNMPLITDYTINKPISGPVIYHSHKAELQIEDTDDLTVVCCIRKNLYATTISSVIGDSTGEWGYYTGKKLPFVADRNTVEQKYVWNRWWHQKFEQSTRYKNKVYLDFDEFTKTPSLIFDKLNLQQTTVNVIKSPYRENHILNIDEVNQWYHSFENDSSLEKLAFTTFKWDN